MKENDKKMLDALNAVVIQRQESLNKAKLDLSKVNQQIDPQGYKNVSEEVNRGKKDLRQANEDMIRFQEIVFEIEDLEMENLNEEKTKKSQVTDDELQRYGELIRKGYKPESPEMINFYKKNYEERAQKIKKVKKLQEEKSNLLAKYKIKENIEFYEKKEKASNNKQKINNNEQNVNNEKQIIENLENQIRQKKNRIKEIKKSFGAGHENQTEEGNNEIKNLKKEISDLQTKIEFIKNNDISEYQNFIQNDNISMENGVNGINSSTNQPRIENKQQEQPKLEDKHQNQPRLEDSHQKQPTLAIEHKDVPRLEYHEAKTKEPVSDLPVAPQIKAIQPSFFEIVAKTDTVHIGNIEGKIHSLAHAPIFQTGLISNLKQGDVVGAITGFLPKTVGSILMLGPKLGAKVISAVGGTNKKFKELQQNIEKLSPEEFEILIGDNRQNNDYSMNETTMTQFKFNDKYLEAIRQRIEVDRQTEKSNLKDLSDEIKKQINILQKEIDSGKHSQSDIDKLAAQQGILSEQLFAVSGQAQALESERTRFEDQMDMKSSRKKNIPGWIAAAHNPNNINSHVQMAYYSRIRAEARANGDLAKVAEMNAKLDQYINDQTLMRMGHISRGNYQKAAVDSSISRAPQTKFRDIISSIGIGSAVLAFKRALDIDQAKAQNQNDLNQQIDAHNREIDSHNQDINNHNAELENLRNNYISKERIVEAENYQLHANAADIRAHGEVENLNDVGVRSNAGWTAINDVETPIDDMIHQTEETTIDNMSSNSSIDELISAMNQSTDNKMTRFSSGRAAEVAYQEWSPSNFNTNRYLDSTAKALEYSDGWKKLWADFLKQNEAIANLSQTPITMANTIDGFTINIPSVLIPTMTSLIANFSKAAQESNEITNTVIKQQQQRQQQKAQKQQQKQQKQQQQKQQPDQEGSVR